ncbi:MAG: DNA-binding transcriptional LysR family regulator [Myxococcota bacterium]|jgi:DNA-binding transcriptional LysR family regulator
MEPSWDDLRLFLACLEAGTLTAAARSLGVGQATVSRRIAALEEHIGQRLFDRHRSGLIPTDAAIALRPHVERMAEQVRLGVAALSGLIAEPEGVVRIAVPAGIAVDVLPPLIPELRRRYPKVRIDILADNFMRDLTRHEADIALRSFRPTAGDLVFQRMPSVPIGAVASSAYVAALPPKATAADLDWLQWSDDLAHTALAQYISAQLDGRDPVLTSNSFPALRAAAQQGLGCMVMPAIQARLSDLVPVPVTLPPLPAAPFYIVVPRALRSVPRVAVVVAFLREEIGRVSAEEGWQDAS